MINQFKLTLLSEENRKKLFDKKGERIVYIDSKHGFWRPNAKGYTDKVEEAWTLPLNEAYEQTKHCGEEKRVRFIYLPVSEEVEVQSLSTEE